MSSKIKKLIIAALIVNVLPAAAQNIQLHYDFGENRQMLTSTVEMFKPDNWGSTFLFVDFNYGAKASKVDAISLAYWEVSRNLKFWDTPILIHLEFNGGIGQYKSSPKNTAYTINNAYLFGPAFSWNNESFTRGFTLQALYKHIKDKHDATFQITGVWYMHFLEGKLTFSGFADFWKEDNVFGTNETSFVFLSEPQLWFNATKNFSVGGEVEISNNFGGNEGFMINPTIGLKWNF